MLTILVLTLSCWLLYLQTQKVEPFEDKIPAQLDKETYMTQLWTLSYKLTGLDFFAKKS